MSDNNNKDSASTNTNDSNWSWFSILNPTSSSNTTQRSSNHSAQKDSINTDSIHTDFEVVHEEIQSKSYTASYDHLLLENNFQINDQYVNLNEYGTTMAITSIDDDEKDENNNKNNKDIEQKHDDIEEIQDDDDNNNNNNNDINDEAEIDDDGNNNDNNNDNINDDVQDGNDNNNNNNNDTAVHDPNDAVMISQTLTLRSRNEELEKERDALHSETLQLRMQTQCLRQTNEHIIAAQQQEIVNLQSKNEELNTTLNGKELQLKQAMEEIARVQRERDNLKKKLHDICYNRLNLNMVQQQQQKQEQNMDVTNSEVLISNKHIIYGCIQCGQHLFDSSAMIQRQIEIDENTFGCLVDVLFNNNDTTMGPTVCKTFLNGMFKVKEIFCDGCLGTFGWKIIESFDEWNTFHQNKYCIDIANIKQI